MLDTIPNTNTDCRKFKKDWGSNKENERDFQDWLYTHATEYKFQNIIRKKYLYNYYPVQVQIYVWHLDAIFSWILENLIKSSAI